MRITIGDYVLVAGREESIEQPEISCADELQVAPLLRAQFPFVANRGNAATVFSFQLTREHASSQEAEQFLMTHKAAIPRTGNVDFTFEDPQGRMVPKKFRLTDGTLHQASGRQIGCATIWRYTLTGGELVAVT